MKKTFISILLAIFLCFAFAGCGEVNDNNDKNSGNNGPDIEGEVDNPNGNDPDGNDPEDGNPDGNDPEDGNSEGDENVAQGYKITFVCDDNVTVYVYETQDMSRAGSLTTTAYSRDGSSGELLDDGNGQVNFKLVFADGYELADIDITEGYNNLKGATDTGVENGYRITKITADLTVTVTSQPEGTGEDFSQGYKVTFVCGEHVSVLVYKTQDMTTGGEKTDTAYSRESGTGILTKTDGQVNFVIVVDEGYQLEDISITEGYKNLKGSEDTGVENGYRITKITADIIVTITVTAIA